MAEGVTSVKAMRAQMAAQVQAEDRCGQVGTSPVAASPAPASSSSKTPLARPVIDGATLRVDDRLRVAKERREEQEKQQATRESQVLERERKSRAQYEQQMEERQRKLEEQRWKEEQRRSAVEEKRRRRQEEEKEHYEAVLQRTLERSQRLDQRQKRWSWGGGVNADSSAPDPAVAIVVSPCSPDKPRKKGTPQVDKRLLKQQADPMVSKHLSSSSAALLNSPDKTGHPLTALTNSCTLNRLLTPTQASIARSRSAAALSALATSSQASVSSLPPARRPLRSRSSDRQKPLTTPAALSSTRGPDSTQKGVKEKRFSSPGTKRPASPSTLPGRRSPSPAPTASSANRRPPSPAPAKPASRSRPQSPTVTKQRPPSPQPNTKPPPIQRPGLTPTGPPTLRKRETKPKESSPVQPLLAHTQETAAAGTASSTKTKDDGSAKGIAGSTSAEEAARILSENRRLAREQKEREEQLQIQREEEERLGKEEEKRLAEEQRVQRLEEECRRAEERKRLEEERLHLTLEERQRLKAEEMARQAELQREREEAEARAQEEAEKQRQERERIMQRNQQERMERRKRIEEIMKRTRKTDQSDSKRDEEKGMLDETEEEDSEAKEQRLKEVVRHADEEQELQQDAERCDHPTEEPLAMQVQPVVNVNEKAEMSTKENNSGEEEVAISLMPKARVVDKEPSDALLPGVKCRVGSWNFEEHIDQPVYPKAQSIVEADGCDLIDADTHQERPWVPFEDKTGCSDSAAAPKDVSLLTLLGFVTIALQGHCNPKALH